jgi:protein O-GlcNAc transferase
LISSNIDHIKNTGLNFLLAGNFRAALIEFEKILSVEPHFPEIFYYKARCYKELGLSLNALEEINKVLSSYPKHDGALNSKGTILQDLRQYNGALGCINEALSLRPNNVEAWNNKGAVLLELKRYDEALQCLNQAIALQEKNVEAWNNLGITLNNLKLFEKAIFAFKKTLSINPHQEFILGMLIHAKMQICDWDTFDQDILELSEKIKAGEKVTPPFPLLALTSDEALHLQAAKIWTNTKHPTSTALPPIAKRERQGKIRLGYYSADFREHPVSYLTAELFECHNKELFELFAFSFGPNTRDQMQTRIAAAFDHFIDVRDKSDLEIAQLSRDLGIDIAVDLAGHTADSRFSIFSYRAAPIQINYIGFIGTTGADYMDYIIADPVMIPVESRQYYSEKILYLPWYQANDSKRKDSNQAPSRTDLGLPSTGFIFCCLNNTYKITPSIFEAWMNILKNTKESVLLLYANDDAAKFNLQERAKKAGIKGDRLIFASRLARSEYLARYKLIDLYLDTAPYNAGTTASDALWAGLPVLTIAGKSMASRMAASLLTSLDLPELIAANLEAYVDIAIKLANNPEAMNKLKSKLSENRSLQALFNTKAFTENLEHGFIQAHRRYQADIKPDHVFPISQ